ALAGGVSVDVPREAGYVYRPGGILSPDGHCRPYDAGGEGTVFGHGMGIVVLRRAGDAWADGDTVRAIVRGSAVNNDGARRAGFTAPSVEGQATVIAEALAVAEVEPESIGYVEGHGTATHIGDAIEISALQRVFGPRGAPGCALGSVKSNAGHMGAAAGIGGFIKAVLAVENGLIPPTLHFNEPHPLLGAAGSPFFVNRELRQWESNGSPRRAGVSSFGQGGTNAHVVLEEAPPRPHRESTDTWQVLPVSASSADALETLRRSIKAELNRGRFRVEDIAFTLQIGRRGLPHRDVLFARGDHAEGDPGDELRRLASAWIAGKSVDWAAHRTAGPVGRVPLPTYPFARKRHWIGPMAPQRIAAPERDAAGDSLEEVIARAFEEVLGVEHAEPDSDFFDLGGTSLLALSVRQRLEEAAILVPQGALWEHPTVNALAESVRRARRAHEDEESASIAALCLDQEVRGADTFQWQSPAHNVLLTGVTGLLGAHLLRELLTRTTATVHCLLRADSVEEALARIRGTLATYGLDGEKLAQRVVAVPADLSRPRLGLTSSDLDRVAETVDAVYHAGASVNFAQPYSVLKATNVDGVDGVLRLATRSRVKPLHYVSSVAVFECEAFATVDRVVEDEDIAGGSGFHNGYDMSKWAAERLIALARDRNVPVSVYRFSNLAGDSRTGIILPQHIISCLIKGCVQLGAAPEENDVVNVLPVDAAAASLVELSLLPEATNGNFHLVNPAQTRIRMVIEWLRARGFPLDTIPYDAWLQRMRAAPLDNAFKPFVELLDQGRLFTNRVYDATNVRRFSTALERAVIDEALLDRYLDYWLRTGYLVRFPA
ncbi:MAG: thioester reductase domain-containing protein, partial [Thermoanaerobaculia bacterium]